MGLRVGLVVDRLDPARGGAEAYLAAFARFLARRGHEVYLLAREAAPGLAGEHVPVRLPPGPAFLKELLFDRLQAARARALHLDVTLGVRHTPSTQVFQPHGGVYSAAVEAQIRSAGPGWAGLSRLGRRLRPKHLALLYLEAVERRRAAGVRFVALSERVRRDMERVYGAREVVVIPNGVDPERFRPASSAARRAARRRFGLPADGSIVLFASHNFRLKGLQHLIRALPRLPRSVFLWILGRDRAGPFVRLATRLGVAERVRFAGFVAAMPLAYQAADFLAHPTYYDPCSTVCLEALAAGLPVITTRANGVAELMDRGGGGLVLREPGDEEGLAEALNRLATDPALRADLGGAARRLAEAHPEETAFLALLQVLTEAAA